MVRSAKGILSDLIIEESILIEKAEREKWRKGIKGILMKLTLFGFFCGRRLEKEEREKWSGSKWYDRELLGGWIYELREKRVSWKDIYKVIVEAKDSFFENAGYRGLDYKEVCSHHHCHKVYDAMRDALMKELNSTKD